MKIVYVSSGDVHGGGNLVGYRLHQHFLRMSGHSLMLVSAKSIVDESVLEIDFNNFTWWSRQCIDVKAKLEKNPFKGSWRLTKLIEFVSNPIKAYYKFAGKDFFRSRSFKRFYKRLPWKPDIFHFHVLHGYGFNLTDLQWLSARHKVFLTLHDGWTFSGHCAHSFDCVRWKTGCGSCPDLTIPPAVERDATHFNWEHKRTIFSRSKLYVATPCHWLMEKVSQSILAGGIVESRVVPYGIDIRLFSPKPKRDLRLKFGFEEHDFILLFAANGIKKNRWKNFSMLREAIERMGTASTDRKIIMIALGQTAPPQVYNHAELIFLPFSTDPSYVAEVFGMSNVYLHASNIDTFPNVVLEAMASGVPVIATAVGGIPEQVKGLKHENTDGLINTFEENEATGILVQNNDVAAMIRAVEVLMQGEMAERLGKNARQNAIEKYDFELQASRYQEWYQTALES